MDDKSDDYYDYFTYEGGPSAASSETLPPMPQIKVFLKLACSDYCVSEYLKGLTIRRRISCHLSFD